MAETEIPAGSPRTPCRVEPVELPHPLLADLEQARGCLTGAAIDYRLPCTAAEGHRCELSMQIPTWNEFLFPAQLQLRDVYGPNPQLCLVSSLLPRCPKVTTGELHQALTCAYWLLKTHQCVVALDLSLVSLGDWEDLVGDALKGNSSIEDLNISIHIFKCPGRLCAAIASLKRVKKFGITFNAVCSPELQDALTTLLRPTASLEALSLSKIKVPGDSPELLSALFANSTLKELSLYECILEDVDTEYRDAFTKYLENSGTLTTLNIFEEPDNRIWGPRETTLPWFLLGLLKSKTVSNVTLCSVTLDVESARLLSKIFAENESLRCFRMISASICRILKAKWDNKQAKRRSLLLAVAGNKSLEEVTLPLQCGNPEDWKLFFDALSSRSNRLSVTIEKSAIDDDTLGQVCHTLRESALDDKVSFTTYESVENFQVLKCKGFSRIFMCAPEDEDQNDSKWWLRFRQLSSARHVTSLLLIVPPRHVNEAVFSVVADYVQATTTLKELHLITDIPTVSHEEVIECWRLFSNSLSQNRSIQEVGIFARNLCKEATELLAHALKVRKDMCVVDFCTEETSSRNVFIKRLSVDVTDNCTLLQVSLHREVSREAARDWFFVQDTVRRNCGLLTRAAQFVSGAIRDRCAVQALERVSGHPALLTEVAYVASVQSGEAAAMIRRALRTIEGIDAFMRLSGVVRDQVICLPCQDGRPQLDDLDEYCWSEVRRYLLIEDVRYSGQL